MVGGTTTTLSRTSIKIISSQSYLKAEEGEKEKEKNIRKQLL